jgi:lantibiotic biosynthesis protein
MVMTGQPRSESGAQPWRPVFAGDAAAPLVTIIEEIAAATAGGPFEPPGNVQPRAAPAWRYSLDGLAGQSLLQAYLALHGAGEARADAAIELLDRATDAAGTLTLAPSLYFGFSGVGWVAAHLTGRLFEESQDNGLEVDDALLGALANPAWTGKYDLFDGLVGIGVYALERLPRPSAVCLLEAIVARLAADAERSEEGAAFHTPRGNLRPAYQQLQPRGTYNLGMAHGVAGIISLLGAMCRAGIATAQARPLLVDSVAWLLARERPEGDGFRFLSTYTPGRDVDIGRLGWCHGDLSVSLALLAAARGTGDAAWERHALRVALAAAAWPVDTTPVPDACLCHGAAGVGHSFNRLYQELGDERLGDAARGWLRRAVAMREPGVGIGGYQMFQSGQKYDHPGVRIGSSGIGLALLAAISPIAPDWDRLLLASTTRGLP